MRIANCGFLSSSCRFRRLCSPRGFIYLMNTSLCEFYYPCIFYNLTDPFLFSFSMPPHSLSISESSDQRKLWNTSFFADRWFYLKIYHPAYLLIPFHSISRSNRERKKHTAKNPKQLSVGKKKQRFWGLFGIVLSNKTKMVENLKNVQGLGVSMDVLPRNSSDLFDEDGRPKRTGTNFFF